MSADGPTPHRNFETTVKGGPRSFCAEGQNDKNIFPSGSGRDSDQNPGFPCENINPDSAQDTPGEGREGGGGQQQTPKGPRPDMLEAKGSEAPHLED